MVGLAQITPRIILTDPTPSCMRAPPLFMRAPPLCSESIPVADDVTLQQRSGGEAVSQLSVRPLGSLHDPVSFLSLPSSAVEPTPGSPCHGRARPFKPQDEASSAEAPVFEMADWVHRFHCSLQCELTFFDALTHP